MNLGITRLIARILRSDSIQERSSTRTHPGAALRLITAIVCITLCALSRNALFTLAVIAAELFRACLKTPSEIAAILRPVWIAVLFAAVFTFPAIFLGSPGSFGTITLKAFESVLVLSLMNEETPWKETTAALRVFHIPEVFIATLDSTIRYLVILGRFSNKMLEAVSLRRVGKKKWKNAGTGGILGTTFLKSQQLALQTSEAMRCRGFQGEYYWPQKRQKTSLQRTVNAFYALLLPVLFVSFFYTQSLV